MLRPNLVRPAPKAPAPKAPAPKAPGGLPSAKPPLRPPTRTAPLVQDLAPDMSTANIARGAFRSPWAAALLGMVYPQPLNADEEALLRSFVEPPQLPMTSLPDPWFKDVERRGGALEVQIGEGPSLIPPVLLPVEILDPSAPGAFVPWGDPLAVPLPLPHAPSAPPGAPGRVPARIREGYTVTVRVAPRGETSVRLTPYKVSARSLPRPSRDGKYSRTLVGMAMRPITATLGLWSEVHDAIDVFSANLYLRDGRTARQAFRGDMLRSLQAFGRGEARLDTLGFGLDFAVNQGADVAVGRVADFQRGLAVRLAGENGYRANVAANRLAKEWGSEDVRFSWIQHASRWVRSQDRQRSERVSRLWS